MKKERKERKREKKRKKDERKKDRQVKGYILAQMQRVQLCACVWKPCIVH